MNVPLAADAPPPAGAVRAPLWLAAVSVAALTLLLVAPGGLAYPSFILGIIAFPIMPIFLPACRPDPRQAVCPRNWALLVFFLQMVVLPVVIAFAGPAQGTLPRIASPAAINAAAALVAVSYLSFCGGCQLASRPSAAKARADRPDPSKTRLYVAAHLIVGVVGLGLSFGGISGVITYFTEPAETRQMMADLAKTTGAAVGTFCRPFLGFAFVLVWCNWVDRRGRIGPHAVRLAKSVALAIPVLLGYATFNYNRGAFVAPLVAMTGVYLARVERLSLATLAGFGSLALGFVVLLGLYRTGGMGLDQLTGDASARDVLARKLNANDEIQVYGSAPQYVGFVLEECDYGRDLRWGETLVSSLLYPLPILGEQFRATSGVVVYNEMIYGNVGIFDQILPFQGELFLNFHIPGIIAGYVLLGVLSTWLQRAYERAGSAIEAFIAMYTAVWLLFLIQGGLASVSQILIYFFWPVYIYLAARWVSAQLRTGPTEPARAGDFQGAYA